MDIMDFKSSRYRKHTILIESTFFLSSNKTGFKKSSKKCSKSRFINLTVIFLIFLTLNNFTLPLIIAKTEETGKIYGKITKENEAVEGANVTLNRLGNSLDHARRETKTGPNGEYIFDNVNLGIAYKVTVIFDRTNHSKILAMENLDEHVNFFFDGRLIVQVLFPDGSAAGGLQLRLFNNLGVNEVNTTTDTTGFGAFEPLDVNDTYFLSFNYKRIPYYADVNFELSNLTNVVINLLDATTSDEDFEVYYHHIVVNGLGSELSFWESASYYNMGTQVFNTSWLNGWFPPDA
jgi:hypothetical protein